MNKQELLTRLGAFVAHKIDVDYTIKGMGNLRCKLCPSAYADMMGDDDITNIKPHFYSFSQLTAPIPFRGKPIVPAEEIAKLASDVSEEYIESIAVESEPEGIFVSVLLQRAVKHFLISHDFNVFGDSYRVYNQVAITDLYRAMHFAVGDWKEGEYTEKKI